MGDTIDITEDKFYYFAASLSTLAMCNNAKLSQLSGLAGGKIDSPGISALAAKLDIEFSSTAIPVEQIADFQSQVKRVSTLLSVVLQTAKEIFGLDTAAALELLSMKYDANDGVGWNEFVIGYGVAVDALSLIALALTALSPFIGDETIVLAWLSANLNSTNGSKILMWLSIIKHTNRFVESDKDRTDLNNFITNVFLSVAWREVIRGKLPALPDADLNKLAQAFYWEQLDWLSDLDGEGGYNASTIQSKINSIKRLFAAQGIVLSDEEIKKIINGTHSAVSALGDIKPDDIYLATNGSLIPDGQASQVPGDDSVGSWWQTRIEDHDISGGAVTSHNSYVEFKNEYAKLVAAGKVPPSIQADINARIDDIDNQISDAAADDGLHSYAGASDDILNASGHSEISAKLDEMLRNHHIDLTSLNDFLGYTNNNLWPTK